MSLNHYHKIVNLRNVQILKNSPWAGKQPRLKGNRAKGKTYERTILRCLKRAFWSLIESTTTSGSATRMPVVAILPAGYLCSTA